MYKPIYLKKSLHLCVLTIVLFINSTMAHAQQKVLFILSAHEHGYWLSEVLTPYKLLSQAGYTIDFASPKGDQGVQAGRRFLEDHQEKLLSEISDILAQPKALSDIDTSKYVALYIPGGAGPMFDLYNHPEVNRITATMYENNKPVSADCHGPAAFAGVMLSNNELMIKGKKAVSYTHLTLPTICSV